MQGPSAARRRESFDGAGDGAQLSRGLAVFSVGLGLTELAAPRRLARLIGVADAAPTSRVLRWLGARELATGLGILARPQRSLPLWTRVAGDAIDLAFLAWAANTRRTSRQRLLGALAAVLGVTALDVLACTRVQRAHRTVIEPVVRSITVQRSPSEVYSFWRDFEQLAMFMQWLASVRDLGGGRSRWTAPLPTGGTIEWATAIVDDVPARRIAWKSVSGELPNRGSVTFEPTSDGTASEVRVELQVAAPDGPLGAVLARWFAGPQLEADLRRFKQVMETGEVLVSDASIHRGRHPAQPSGTGGAP